MEWAGDYHLFKTDLERTELSGVSFHAMTGAEMSFQHEEQEFDFSYLFEDSECDQSEPERGGYFILSS